MNLLEAIKSGKSFRRPHFEGWILYVVDGEISLNCEHIMVLTFMNEGPMQDFSVTLGDLLAEDYEVKDE